MQYKISYEPLYDNECIYLLRNIINNKSVQSELERILKDRGGAVSRQALDLWFSSALALEEYVKNNLSFDQSTAQFLFTNRDGFNFIPASIFFFYDQFINKGVGNKILAILIYAMDEKFAKFDWELNPPAKDKDFFDLIDENITDDAVKLDIFRLYHNFDFYHKCVSTLIEQVTALIKQKLANFTNEIKHCMDYVSQQMEENSEKFLREKLHLVIDNQAVYHLHPSVYRIDRYQLIGSALIDHCILFGTHFFDIANLSSKDRIDHETIMFFLKCIADNTKMSIIKLLNGGPMYASELSETLQLSGSTISHHMSALTKLDMVFMQKENVKVFYILNQERIESLWETVRSTLLAK